jgi:hypothetical protein
MLSAHAVNIIFLLRNFKMKKGLIFTVMLVGVLVLGFSQSALSGTYRYDANYYITFIGNNFAGRWGSNVIAGTYSVSGTRLTLNITDGTVGRNTWNWTIVDTNTLRDHDGDSWRKEGGGSAQNSGSQTSNPYADTRWGLVIGNGSITVTMTNNGFTFVIISSGETTNYTGPYTYSGNNIRFSNPNGVVTTASVIDNIMTLRLGGNEYRLTKLVGDFLMNGTTLAKYYGIANNVTIPAGVTAIGDYAFFTCTSLTSVTIPSSVTSIGDEAFRNCTSLTSVTISSGVTAIGALAFFGCSSLTSITIPSSVTSIGEQAFLGCSSLTSITIPSSVTSIEAAAFGGCTSLTGITVDAQNRDFSSVDGVLFNNNRTELITYPAGKQGNYTIPSSVTSIDRYSFYSCRNLTGVTIPSSVTLIGAGAFQESGLTSITIPSSVTVIGGGAFRDCTNLRTVTVSRRTTLGANVFPSTARITYSD